MIHTRIPAITSYYTLPVASIVQLYIVGWLTITFLFEMPLIQNFVSISASFFWAWAAIRCFTVSKEEPFKIGDVTDAFKLSSFLPEKARGIVDSVSDLAWKVNNSCGLITALQKLC